MKPIRIQRKRVKGWKMPVNCMYVGRPTKWGNPFKLTKDGWIMYYKAGKVIGNPWCYWSVCGKFSLLDIVELYEKWLTGEVKRDYLPVPPNVAELNGKNLACFCKIGDPCHADVLLKLANK